MPDATRIDDRSRAAVDAILRERQRQRDLWSTDHDDKHMPEDWLIILNAYTGKLSQCVHPYVPKGSYNKEKIVLRLTQLAAISMAAIEALSE